MSNYRRDMNAIHDKIVARERRHSEERAARGFRRICAFCKGDMGPAIGNYTGDTHGMHWPPCQEAIDMGWDQ